MLPSKPLYLTDWEPQTSKNIIYNQGNNAYAHAYAAYHMPTCAHPGCDEPATDKAFDETKGTIQVCKKHKFPITVKKIYRGKTDVQSRNDLCKCGSGKKYKKCCMSKYRQE